MNIKRIALDLDNVLNTFTMYTLRWFGCNVGDFDLHRFPAGVGHDIVTAYNLMKPEAAPALDNEQFWKRVPRQLWATAPQSKECAWLLLNAESAVGRENVIILTSPTNCPESLAGKLEWIHREMPPWMHKQFLVGSCKHFCARPDTLLIDDHDGNTDKFTEHGGQALLVPRPWNRNRDIDTFAHLRAAFQSLPFGDPSNAKFSTAGARSGRFGDYRS